MKNLLSIVLGAATVALGITCLSSIGQTQPPILTEPGKDLILPRRETIFYPSASSSLTIPDPRGAAAITLDLLRENEAIRMKLSATSLTGDRCALVSVQLPPNILIQNDQYQLTTTPIIFIPLTSKAGYCGSTSIYRQTYVPAAKTEHQALLRLPFTNNNNNNNVQIPFTVEVFFMEMSN